MVAPFGVCPAEGNVTLEHGGFGEAGGQVFAPLMEILASQKFQGPPTQ